MHIKVKGKVYAICLSCGVYTISQANVNHFLW